MKWYKYVTKFQRIINSTVLKSAKHSPFELMIGVNVKGGDIQKIRELLEEYNKHIIKIRENLREEVKWNTLKIQEDKLNQFSMKKKGTENIPNAELVAIHKTQYGASMKL